MIDFKKELELLEAANQIITTHEAQKIAKGELFNIFEILDINTKEVKICAFLAELINPIGRYPFARHMLASFIQNVLKIQLEAGELDTVRVYTEYRTNTERRIDIVIESAFRFIPIEVKIYASDQYLQCQDYYHYSISKQRKYSSKIYYLTLDGHMPSEESYAELSDVTEKSNDNLCCISFKKEILDWLKSCMDIDFVKNETYSYVILKQFTEAIERLCYAMGDKSSPELIALISKNAEAMKTACVISDSINDARIKLLGRIFDSLSEKLRNSKFMLEPLNNKFDYRNSNSDKLKKYYQNKNSTYPGISYHFKSLDNNRDLWFRIEINHRLFCGFVLTKNNDWSKFDLSEEELYRHTKKASNSYSWWGNWEYLPTGLTTPQNIPDFKDHNDAYFELFDNNKFVSFIDKSVERVLEILTEAGL